MWNRNLDDVDTTRELEEEKGGTPDEIPGAMVVSVLEKTQVPWVIVTNGKLWRLYSSTASNKATNYYEVDLEEAIAATDQITALKYWWLMFRQGAFTGFLDTLLSESDKYAAQLRERLKDDVFLRIFPQFAKGFITHMRAQGVKAEEIDLDLVFSGTMTFLYRMMFILYAESLDLLPVSEERGYGEYSLHALKRDLVRVGGEAETDSPERLRKHYTTKSTTIYDRLKLLFGVIDKGSADLNMPTYNGGLFSAENESGLFLERYAIPDQFLMLGLDRLTRDEDDKTKKLVFIDFKSLGVRQLGSIYEGLLEFKLKIAAEPLAVEKDGKRELYIPLKKAKKKDAAAAVAKGEPYLENDKQERKATGSYYTPDYIVKYIVQHTVGPVLERKLNECAPRLRQAQADYRAYVKLVEARRKSTGRDESPVVFWNSDDMALLVDDCLNLRVLDPAMGSGHFLVEVVDFVSNKLIDFLNGWSENPVWAALDRIREDILADMERQHVTIDADKLTRVALLKRAVLKRCVYGVDLNLMAVELAKVSLWLDAFTLGAPLSFLDHHLKWGNSLIGARVREVQTALEGQQTLFSSNKFAGVMLATDLMQKVSYLSDNTVAQVQASQNAYRNANDHLAPYKRVLDVYTSRWFGNTPIVGRRGSQGIDVTVEFLKRDDTQAWLEDPRNPKHRLPADDYMKAGLVAKTALQAAESKHFFHWELEFPEVFFAPSNPGGQDVKLREDGGFDAVVGNPPYGVTETLPNFDSDLQADLFVYFWVLLFKYVNPNGSGAFITPSAWLTGSNYLSLRTMILEQGQIYRVIVLPYDVFPDAYIDTCIGIIGRSRSNTEHSVLARHMAKRSSGESIWSQDLVVIDINAWRSELQNRFVLNLDVLKLGRFYNDPKFHHLGEVIRIERGVQPYGRQKHTNEQIEQDFLRVAVPPKDTKTTYYPELLGEELARYEIHPEKRNYLEYSDRLASKREEIMFNGKRVVLRRLLNRRRQLMSAVTAERLITTDNVINIVIQNTSLDPGFICALLNSAFIAWLYTNQSAISIKDDFPQITLSEVGLLPIPLIPFRSTGERKHSTNTIIEEYSASSYQLVLRRSAAALAQGQTDVVHDVLAYLAGQMIDLNQRKQAEVKRFLGWLEGKLKIAPKADGSTGIDSLTGKSILQGYFGDYQKGKLEIAWKDFLYRLHQNRGRFGVALPLMENAILIQYTESLDVLLPIKDQLAKTDALIDKIVYQLYGLTAAEIELIERPQYEQALADAKADALKDETLTDDEQKLDKIAEGILPAAQRFFERIDPADVESALDGELPNWRALPPDAPTFLLTGDYNLRSLPDHMDFSSSVIPYSKAVEVALHRRIFDPFRKAHRDTDCRNEFLQKFMRGEKELTLGNYMIILSSTGEKALRGFASGVIRDVDGLATTLNDEAMRDVRNKAAHDEVISRDEAGQARVWAFEILGMV